MLSLMDWYNTARSNAYFEKTFKDRSHYFTIDVRPLPDFTPDKVVWLCFSGFLKPKIDLKSPWGVHNLFPKEGKVYVITGPDAIAGFTPHDSVEGMQRLEAIVARLAREHSDRRLSIFSASAGTYPGFYFANKYKASRLIALSPGPRMGEGIYTSSFSAVLREKCIEAGFLGPADYDRVIARFNQENNLENLPCGDDLMIFGAAQDLVILNWGTKEIAEKCKAAGKDPRFENYALLDHTSLGAWLGFLNMVGLNPYRLRGDIASTK
jgi:hypothetical protein